MPAETKKKSSTSNTRTPRPCPSRPLTSSPSHLRPMGARSPMLFKHLPQSPLRTTAPATPNRATLFRRKTAAPVLGAASHHRAARRAVLTIIRYDVPHGASQPIWLLHVRAVFTGVPLDTKVIRAPAFSSAATLTLPPLTRLRRSWHTPEAQNNNTTTKPALFLSQPPKPRSCVPHGASPIPQPIRRLHVRAVFADPPKRVPHGASPLPQPIRLLHVRAVFADTKAYSTCDALDGDSPDATHSARPTLDPSINALPALGRAPGLPTSLASYWCYLTI
ncbi:hypothetical protein BJ912DRAFT_1144559 [Pholiota molesta]|nr:hypothetical protein BJ912DRAFT_1144559 [Pholiota molesta]